MKRLMPLGLIVIVALLGMLVGLGGGAILAGLTAMFCLMAAFGGSLAGDLRLLAWFGPLLVLAAGGIQLLSAAVPRVAAGLLVLVVFVACLLPALGSRYVTVGMGLGMASVFSFGLTGVVGAGGVAQSFGAPALGVAVVAALRWLSGRRDPDQPVRAALADALAGEQGPAQEGAVQLWLVDRPRRWTTAVLNGIVRYRNSSAVLASRRRLLGEPRAGDLDHLLAAAGGEADRLADAVRPARPPEPLPPVRRAESGAMALPGASRELVTSMWQGLELVRAAAADRDNGPAVLPRGLRGHLLAGEVRGALSWRSVRLRHAVRCALGMLAALVVIGQWPVGPFAISFLMATFAIMQPTWQDTLARALQRVGGALAGAAALALLVWLFQFPQPALVGLGASALLVGFYFMQSRPVVGNACMVFTTVSLNATTRHLDPRAAMLEVLGLMLLAAVIGLLFGFAAVPGVRTPGVADRFADAVLAHRELLRAVSGALYRGRPDPRPLRGPLRTAARAQQNLVAPTPGGREPTVEQQAATERGADALRGLTTTVTALLRRRGAAVGLAAVLGEVARQLDLAGQPEPTLINQLMPAGADDEQRLLVDAMTADVLAVHEASTGLRPAE